MLRNEEGFPAEPNFKLEYKTSISDMKLSYHEKFLAVALKVFNEGNAKIEMYFIEILFYFYLEFH